MLAAAAVGLLTTSGQAGSIDLAWDGVAGASGYRIYYGTASGQYAASLDVGNTTSARLGGLDDCTDYYVSVKAYSAAGESAGFSNEIAGWAHPSFEPTAVAGLQGSQIVLDIDGANFDAAGTVTLDTSHVPLDVDGEPLVRFESLAVLACDRIQALVTIEPTAAGFQAMQLGGLPLGVQVVHPDGVHGTDTFTLDVQFEPARADINRDAARTVDRVDGDDLASFAQAWASSLGDDAFEFDCDLDGDTDIDGEDLALLAAQFGTCHEGSAWTAAACL
jgi:hypothetical protein